MVEKKLVITDFRRYEESVVKLCKRVAGKHEAIGYVTLNKSYRAMEGVLEKAGIDRGKFYFLDAITPKVLQAGPSDTCTYIESVEDLNAFTDTLLNTIKLKDLDFLLFDSVSSFLIFVDEKGVMNFFAYLLPFLERLGVDAALIVLEDDLQNPAVKQIQMGVNVIEDLTT